MAISIPCTHCGGKGRKELCPQYEQTLRALAKLKRATYGDIKNLMQKSGLLNGTCAETVIHKRVARLVGMGLVKKVGRKLPKAGQDQRSKAWLFELA